jgi:hypothetical protein
MEGGRQADIAKAILAAKNVPYFVAAPLLIQVRSISFKIVLLLIPLGFLLGPRSHRVNSFVLSLAML